jgi:hypothetical protein
MKTGLCPAILLSLVCLTSAFAQDGALEFEGRYWAADLDAKVKVVSSGIGDTFNLKNDLGIADEDFPEGRVIWHTGPNSRIRLSYTLAEYTGDQSVTRTIDFNGKSYTLGSRVESKLDLQYFGLGWIWQFISMADERIKLGTVLELKGVSADVSLKAPSLGYDENENFIGGLPVAGLALELAPFKDFKARERQTVWSRINFFAEASGMSAGSYGYFVDAEAGIKISPLKHLTITGGWRLIDIKAEDKPDFAKLRLKGPFASATFRF